MTIHTSHPFLEPAGERSPLRRLRGRQGGAVSVWTAGGPTDRAGLTVTSWLVAEGEPGRLLALLDPDSDLADALVETKRGVVQLLRWGHRDLADAFSGTAPAPGGPWRLAQWEETSHGPRLADATAWALVRVEDVTPIGWSHMVTCVVDEAELGSDADALAHRRGRYVRAPGQ